MVLAAELGQETTELAEALRRRAGEPVGRPHVDAEQLTAGAHRHAGRAPQHVLAARRAGDRDDHPLAGLPGPGDAVQLAVLLERLVDPVGHPHQRELAEGAEVPVPEVVGQRGVDLLGRVDVAVGHPAPQRLRGLVDELDLVGRAHHRVGDRLALLDAGDLLDHVVHRLEVLDVDGRDHVDAGLQQLLDVLPALLVAGPGHVRVRQLVDQRDLRAAGQDRVDVHLLERRPAVLDPAAGTTSRSPSCAAVFTRPWVSTKPTTTSVPRSSRDAGPR